MKPIRMFVNSEPALFTLKQTTDGKPKQTHKNVQKLNA